MTVLGSIDIQFTDSSSYTWIAYADDDKGTNISLSPDGKTYMGIAYNKKIPEASMIPADYTWSLIVGEGIPGPPGDDGVTLYTWIKYADDDKGTGMTDSPVNKKYMGIAYNKSTQTESANPADYSWSLIKGADGYTPIKGVDYFDGKDGANGVSGYLWVKYSANANGNPMTDNPSGALYIGIATTTTSTAPTSYTAYKWSLFKGTDGVPGEPGNDGKTSYLHIKYSNDGGKTFTGNNGEDVGEWIGTYVDFNSADSNSVAAYTWNKVKGADGQTTYTWIKYADDNKGTGMSDSPDGKRFMGIATNKTTAIKSSNPADYTWSPLYDNVAVGRNLFLDSFLQRVTVWGSTVTRTASNPTNIVKASYTGTGGNFGIQHATSDRKISYKNGLDYILSFDVRGNVSNFNYVYMMRSSAEGGNSAFSSKAVSLSETEWTRVSFTKKALWSTDTGYILIGSTDVGAGKWFEIKEPYLGQANLDAGWSPTSEESTNYTWIMYGDDSAGSNITSNPAGRFWRGRAFNKPTPTPSNNPADYTWEFIPDGWVKPGTVQINGGNIYADSLSAISANLGDVTAGNISGVNFKGTNLTLEGLLNFPLATTDEKGNIGLRGRYNYTENYAAYNSKIADGEWNLTSASLGFNAKITIQKNNITYYGTSYYGASLLKMRAYTNSSNNNFDGVFSNIENRIDISPAQITMGQSASTTTPDWGDNIKITAGGTISGIDVKASSGLYANNFKIKDHSINMLDGGQTGGTVLYFQDNSGGYTFDCYAKTFVNKSEYDVKQDFTLVNPEDMLGLIEDSDVVQYRFINDVENGRNELYTGFVIGGEFATPLEFMNYDQDGINTYKVIGVMAGAIQALSTKIKKLEAHLV